MNSHQSLHTEKVRALLGRLEDDRASVLRLGRAVIGEPGAPMFPLDLLACGAIKRNLSAASAMKLLVESWNMASARSLLRIHLDTALRFSAAWLVENPHEFATLAISGRRIDKMKDRRGRPLSDAYLVETQAKDYPWLPAVYESLCGYVHFSGTHVVDAVESINDAGTLSLLLSETDIRFPESSWLEIVDCFRDGTKMLERYLEGYAQTKKLSADELGRGRAAMLAAERAISKAPKSPKSR